MDTFLIVGLMGIGAIMVGFVGFKFYTDTIIDEQEKEIAALRNENRRLQAALRGKRYVQNLVVKGSGVRSKAELKKYEVCYRCDDGGFGVVPYLFTDKAQAQATADELKATHSYCVEAWVR